MTEWQIAAINWFFDHPELIFGIFPLLFLSIGFSVWRDHRKQVKLEANPNRMDEDEYKRFNNKRFSK